MTTYGAYDKGLPCQNPSCKSVGKPHPNCRCFQGLASGGEVFHYCSESRPHEKSCEYYAKGGEVDPSSVPVHQDPGASVASFLGSQGLHGLIKMGSDDPEDSLERYNKAIKHGHKKLHTKVNHLFSIDSLARSQEKVDHSKAHKAIGEWIDKGGITNDIQHEIYNQNSPQQLAHGGEVDAPKAPIHDAHIASAYPEQNVVLQAAKGRMSNYLSSLKPQKDSPKLAFDEHPDTRQQEKSYHKAMAIAADPLHVLDKVKDGTIEPEHIKHLQNLHPEVNTALQQKITERITEAQLKKEMPSHHVRQGLSMLMGVPLMGELTPQHIQAAQSTFQTKQAAQPQGGGQPATKNKKDTATLTKASQAYLTSDDARASRQQRQPG